MQSAEAYEHKQSLETRLAVMRVGVILALGALVVSFWLLQVVQNSKYETMARTNHLRVVPMRAPRGVLFDRYGRELVQNRRSWTITIVRERDTRVPDVLARLAPVVGLDQARVEEILARQRRQPLFRIPVVERATLEQVAAVAARQLDLPEVAIDEVPTRAYPSAGMAAHLFGYVGEIRPEQVGSAEFQGLEAGAVVGQTGLERTYNGRLQGADGRKHVVVNSVGREIEVIGEEEATSGSRLQLTIDYDLQKALEDGFQALGFTGASAILDPRNGEILAMTSLPSYDPNDFAEGIDGGTFAALNSDPQKPFLNKLIRGTYAPGSTFKIVMALAALGEGLITPEHTEFCAGATTIYGRSWQCLGRHGVMDLRHALERSCNVYFYKLGERFGAAGIDQIHEYSKKLGLVGASGLDLPGEQESFVGSTEWKLRARNERWYPGDTISVAIGQGMVAVTPMAMAAMISTVANGGTLVTPHLVRATDDGPGWQPVPAPAAKGSLFIRPDHLQAVRDGLWMVVNANGTGVRSRIAGRDVAGKTGTAQANVSLANQRAFANRREFQDHGWFVFFAPRDNPRIAGVIFGEHALHGSWTAPIAKHVMETFFAKEDGLPLPASPLSAVAAANRAAGRPAAGAPAPGAPAPSGPGGAAPAPRPAAPPARSGGR